MAHRTLTIYHRLYEYKLQIPNRWPDSAMEKVQIRVLNDDGDVVVIHPEEYPMIYRRKLKKYFLARETIDGNYREVDNG